MANAAERVYDLIKETVEGCGVRLWDVRFLREGASWYLRVFIDKDEGISIDDCTEVSHAIDPIIDEADPIDEAYYLEVTSPGIEREIKTDAHISMCLGEQVELKLYAPKNGTKQFRGVLVGYDADGNIVIENGGESIAFKPDEVAKISTYFDFSNS